MENRFCSEITTMLLFYRILPTELHIFFLGVSLGKHDLDSDPYAAAPDAASPDPARAGKAK